MAHPAAADPALPRRGMSDLAIRNWFIIPTIVFLIVFNIFPLLYSLGYSFTDYRASMNDPVNFVGLQNYRELLADEAIWSNFTITAKYVVMSVAGQVLVGFGAALLLNRAIPAKGVAAAADRGDLSHDGGVQDLRHRVRDGEHGRDRARRDPALQDGVPGVADGPLMRARLPDAARGARDHECVREVPEPAQGAIAMERPHVASLPSPLLAPS